MDSLHGKVALVTGGGSGIGRAAASIMAMRGALLAVSDIRPDAAESVAAEIRDAGGQAIALACDVGEEQSIAAAVGTVVDTFGRLDILHNNAALLSADVMAQDIDILSIPTALWDRVMSVTLRGVMLGCRYGVREMLKTGGGAIVNTSSISGLSGHLHQVAYGCAKAGVNCLTEYVATAYGRNHIRCNAVAPSLIMTPPAREFIPEGLRQVHEASTSLPSLGEPEDVGHLVAFLASDEARFITGEVIRVDGGMLAHLPIFADAKRFHALSPAVDRG